MRRMSDDIPRIQVPPSQQRGDIDIARIGERRPGRCRLLLASVYELAVRSAHSKD
jgi:hypothetical protein